MYGYKPAAINEIETVEKMTRTLTKCVSQLCTAECRYLWLYSLSILVLQINDLLSTKYVANLT